jgi:hypothetical protein
MPASRNTTLPIYISSVINKAERNGKVKNQAMINYLRSRNNTSKLFNNSSRYYYNIRPLHNKKARPTGRYKLWSRHKGQGNAAERNLSRGEAAIIKAIQQFMKMDPRRKIENLMRIRALSRSKIGHPNLTNQVYGHMTSGRTPAGNAASVARAMKDAQHFNAEVRNLNRRRPFQ